ncbi:hypothetical protein R6Q59_033218 [Mikania micrantha]
MYVMGFELVTVTLTPLKSGNILALIQRPALLKIKHVPSYDGAGLEMAAGMIVVTDGNLTLHGHEWHGSSRERVINNQTPSDFLKSIRGRPVVVKLNSGVDYRGILACLDGYMNIAMEQTEEYVNGQLKNKYGDAFIRGSNVLYISTSKRTIAEDE